MSPSPPSSTDPSRRRSYLATLVALSIAVPAATLVSQRTREDKLVRVDRSPFCSLPSDVRDVVQTGYRQGRSGDVFAVAAVDGIGDVPTGTQQVAVTWPTGRVPQAPAAIWGRGIKPLQLPAGTRVDALAPTLAAVMDLERPHPEVRSGRTIEEVLANEERPPRLVVLIGWKRTDGERSVELADRIRAGAGTEAASLGSLTADPAAVFATFGSGGLPFQHGITGTLVRNDGGQVVEAFSRDAPSSVIATLADDLENSGGSSKVGLVGTTLADRSLIGDDWYLDGDRDEVEILGRGSSIRQQGRAAKRMLDSGFGRDGATDLLAVAFSGPSDGFDRALLRIERAALEASGDSSTFALVAVDAGHAEIDGAEIVTDAAREGGLGARAILGVGGGSIFLDQEMLSRRTLSDQGFIRSLRETPSPGDEGKMFRDVFSSDVLTFAEYC